MRKRLVPSACLGEQQAKVENGIGTPGRNGALVSRPRTLDVTVIPKQAAKTRGGLAVSSGLGALESIGCIGQITAALEKETEQNRTLGIVELVGFPISLFRPTQIPGCLAIAATAHYFFYGHDTAPVCRVRGV
jgi:hypothetical protein